MKKSLFDMRPVLKAADKNTVAVFKKFGAFVRQTAKQSIRKSKKSSEPGKPPKSHKGLLKKFLYFWVDTRKLSVIIGPAKLNGAISPNEPEALEKGGRTTILAGPKGQRVRKSVVIKPRPFMGPAVKKEKAHLPKIWSQSVRSS